MEDKVTFRRYAIDENGEPLMEEIVWRPALPTHQQTVSIHDLPFGPSKRRMDGIGGYPSEWNWASVGQFLTDGVPLNPYAAPLRAGIKIVTQAEYEAAVAARDAKNKEATEQMDVNTDNDGAVSDA